MGVWLRARPCELVIVVHEALLGRVPLRYVHIGHDRSQPEVRDAVEPLEVSNELSLLMDRRRVLAPILPVVPLRQVGLVIGGLVGVAIPPPSVHPVKIQIGREHHWRGGLQLPKLPHHPMGQVVLHRMEEDQW